MPACDMFPSIVIRAPVTAFAWASTNLRVILAGPTRAGSGVISCSIVTAGLDSTGFRQAVKVQTTTTKAANRQALRIGSSLLSKADGRPQFSSSRLILVQGPPRHFQRSGSGSQRVCMMMSQRARAPGGICFTLGRENMVVHPDHHWNENKAVVKQMQLNAGHHELKDAHRNR